MISETYQKNLQSALSQASLDPSLASDGASRTPQLTQAQMDEIFLKSIVVDNRGIPYGLGRLSNVHTKKKKAALVGPSPALQDLEAKLKEVNSKIEEQVVHHKHQMTRFFEYLKKKDPDVLDWLLDDVPDHTSSDNPVQDPPPSEIPGQSNSSSEDGSDENDDEHSDEDGNGADAQLMNGEDQNT